MSPLRSGKYPAIIPDAVASAEEFSSLMMNRLRTRAKKGNGAYVSVMVAAYGGGFIEFLIGFLFNANDAFD